MKINPILIKELKIRARTMRIPIFVMLYVVLMAFVAVFLMITAVGATGNGSGSQYYSLNELFSGLGLIQCLMVCLVALAAGASSFASEKESGTLDMLLMTPVRSWEVVNGKLFSSAITGCFFVSAAMPVLALGTIYGGAGLEDMVYLAMIIILLSFVCSSIGMFCSVVFERFSVAMVVTVILFTMLNVAPFLFGDFLVTYFQGMNVAQVGNAVLLSIGLLTTNPLMIYYDFFDRVTGAELIVNEFLYGYGIMRESELFLFLEKYFITVCVAVQLLIILLFLCMSVFVLRKKRNVR